MKGALEAAIRVVRYCIDTKHLCLHQPWGFDSAQPVWRFFSDSDQSGDANPEEKRRNRLSYIAMKGRAPIAWGSKTTKVSMGADLDSIGRSHRGLDAPTCHPDMLDLHADVSSAAAEIFAASVALNEFLHLGYVSDELGMSFPRPIELEVDNQTAIMFSKDTVRRSKLRHIDSRQSWVEALRDNRIVEFVKVHTDENLADMNSKLLGAPRFLYLRDKIMVSRNIPEEGEEKSGNGKPRADSSECGRLWNKPRLTDLWSN